MIKCNGITKAFGDISVLNNFFYTFDHHGFYLLLGESGSGKTTLINILSGMISYDSGGIDISGKVFEHRVDPNAFDGGMDYITQDPYFIDYLTVKENLKIALDDENQINSMLEQFGLSEQASLLPTAISGGEKQRLALARAMLTKKSVMFLDEPTASLDNENKQKVFACIKELSKHGLVICASHDIAAKAYADTIIVFDKCIRGEKAKEEPSNKPAYALKTGKKKKHLLKYLSRWFSSQRRGKATDILLTVFLTLAMLMCMIADTPENKAASNMEYVYKTNALYLCTKSSNLQNIDLLEGQHGIIDVVLDYSTSVPDASLVNDEYPEHETTLGTLPFDKEAFRLADKLAVGTWFEEKNDIILYAEMADYLAKDHWESLLGTTLPVRIYGLGETEMRIVGVFEHFNDLEKQYISCTGTRIADQKNYEPENYQNLFFINSLITEELQSNEKFYAFGGQRGYYLYFDSYKSMTEYAEMHDEAYGTITVPLLSSNIRDAFEIMALLFLPLTFLVLLISVLNYANIIGTELAYNSRFISAFNYIGYGMKDIIRGFAFLNTVRLFIICSISAILALTVSFMINYINSRAVFIGCQIFTYSPVILLIFAAVLCISAVISISFFLRKAKAKTWYENIITSRDLL